MTDPLDLVTKAGAHRYKVTYEPGTDRKVAQLAAEIVADCADDSTVYTRTRASTHLRELAEMVSVSCSCNEPTCVAASSYVRGLLEGLRLGSIRTMEASDLHDQLRARREAASPVASVLRSVRAGLNPAGAGVAIEYDALGRVTGTRPR